MLIVSSESLEFDCGGVEICTSPAVLCSSVLCFNVGGKVHNFVLICELACVSVLFLIVKILENGNHFSWKI